MVCKKCEKVNPSTSPHPLSLSLHLCSYHSALTNHHASFQKLSKVAAPDPFTSSSSAIKEGTRKVGGGNALLSRPGPSKTTFGPPSVGGSKNRFTVRNMFAYALFPLILFSSLFVFLVNSRTDQSAKTASRRQLRTERNIATVR